VGDYLVFHPTSDGSTNYNEVEYRYIITKNSSTSYVLSSTAGGSENALTYTHTGGYVFNDRAGKNVKWQSSDGYYWHLSHYNTSATNSNSIMRWVRVGNTYSSGSNQRGAFAITQGAPLVEYITLSRPGVSPSTQLFRIYSGNNSAGDTLIKGLFAYGGTTSAQDGVISFDAVGCRAEDCWVIGTNKIGIYVGGNVSTLTECGWIACSTQAYIALWGGLSVQANAVTINDCEGHANNSAGIVWASSSADFVANRYISGTKGANFSFSQCSSTQSYITAFFKSPYKNTATPILYNQNFVGDSKIVLSDINGVKYENAKVTKNGEAHITGPSLSDTTAPVLGSYTYRHDPVTALGM
jgi:hypothetical protein